MHPCSRPEVASLECQLTQERTRLIRVAGDGFKDLILVRSSDGPSEEISLEGISFSGKVLWLREHETGEVTVFAHGCRGLRLEKYGVNASFDVAQDFAHGAMPSA